MTVTTHITEILRQGIWASFTGGWYYEPSYSIFCNTVHVYVWMMVFVVPLCMGIFVSGAITLPLIAGYIGFTVILFTIIKVIISYLHMVFDTTDPVVVTRTINDSIDETIRDSEQQVLDSEMIELRDMGAGYSYNLRGSERALDRDRAETTRGDRDSIGAASTRRQPESLTSSRIVPRDDASVSSSRHLRVNDENAQLAERSSNFSEQINEVDEEVKPEDSEEGKPENEKTDVENEEEKPVCGEKETSSEEPPAEKSFRRKFSEPILTMIGNEVDDVKPERKLSHDSKVARVRRANSSFEPRPTRSTDNNQDVVVLSEQSLQTARKTTNKSVPSKISSSSEFSARNLEESRQIQGEADLSCDGAEDKKEEKAKKLKKKLKDKPKNRNDSETEDEPSHSAPRAPTPPRRRSSSRRSSSGTTPRRRAASPAVFERSLGKRQSIDSMNSVAVAGWAPVVVSLGDIDRPTTSRLSADEESGADIKVEITKFLEDLIDKHPETLDAIESVRMSRLGRGLASTAISSTPVPSTSSVASSSTERVSHGILSVPSALRSIANRRAGSFMDWHAHLATSSTPAHHIASGHEDTTQGAVHSFQDEDGTWWTYAFDENGVGTAQPLGSGRAILELLNRERDSTSQSHESTSLKGKTWPAAELEVLPESMYDSSDEDDDEDVESARATAGSMRPTTSSLATVATSAVVAAPTTSATTATTTTRRERALSSSSNESCTYIPTLPSSVFHAPTGTGASRGNNQNRSQVSFNAASLLRAAMRNGETSDDTAWQMEMMELMEATHARREMPSFIVPNRMRGESMPPGAAQNAYDRFFLRLDSASSSAAPSRFRFLSDLGLTGVPHPIPIATPDFSTNRRPSNIRKSYYYQMKVFPKAQKSLNLKLDRPSVDRLFDRNHCIWSLIGDIVLAAAVSALAALVLHTNIYFDYHLVMFAFTVAGAHFSLLKSVQPDAASPIHGFNWIVAYSRPVYFCLFASALLGLHYASGGNEANDIVPWNFNPFRLYLTSWSSILVALRDVVAIIFLCHPYFFTLGWMPQVNTLLHHVLEQCEMHICGGTASFGVGSAIIQLVKSALGYAGLTVLCRFAYITSSTSTQTPAFSAFIAVCVTVSYVLSRIPSNQQLSVLLFESICSVFRSRPTPSASSWTERTTSERDADKKEAEQEHAHSEGTAPADDLLLSLRRTMAQRARFDVFFSILLALAVFAIHSSSIFTATRPYFTSAAISLCVLFGVLNHYIYPQFRSHTPWRVVSRPILRSEEYGQFESPKAAALMVFEAIHVWMSAIERNVLYPLMTVSLLTESGWSIPLPWLFLPIIAMRVLRGGFAQPQLVYVPLAFAGLASVFDWRTGLPFDIAPEKSSWSLMPLVLYVLIVIYPKCVEMYLKLNFVMAYVAPWQISWGSAFHAFAQPFSVPHSALIGVQTLASSILSAPLNPFLGSSFFFTSYVRPVKFWERDYNTRRADASNMRLASQLDRGPMLDDSNLNAVFYEHLTRSLQKSLAGDLAMGRWSTSVQPGDCFILASFYLNCLVHIIEVGNGFVTFQLRGLEFRGTYCHQREVEAISEDQSDGSGCCCCAPGSLPGLLSLNTAWGLRWLAWEVVTGKYIIDGYSISDNSAVNLLQVHELRRLLVTLYVKCIVYYMLKSTKLVQWIENEAVRQALQPVRDSAQYADLDSMFCSTNDEDFDHAEGGISRASFAEFYGTWINYCMEKRAETNVDETIDHFDVFSICYLLSLVGRRALGTAAFNRHSNAAESFLYGLHALFKGDFRIMCQRDEWVFADMDMLRCVVAPAVKMALKLHQDHFAHFEEFDDAESLFDLIGDHQSRMFISHEQDPGWRRAILANTPSLLALRHMYDDGQDDYKIIMLNKMHLNMRVIKLNRECVRAFWAGQQQELIFLRNRNPERGSIQNARQVLRNMINSSADQPVGYPIYVSPLTTSLIETHSQMDAVFGPTITIERVASFGRRVWSSLRSHFGPSGSTSVHQAAAAATSSPPTAPPAPVLPAPIDANRLSTNSGVAVGEEEREVVVVAQKAPTPSLQLENSIVEMTRDGGARVSVVVRRDTSEPSTSAMPLAMAEREKLMSREKRTSSGGSESSDRVIGIGTWVQIMDAEHIFKFLNEPLKSTGLPLVVWPDEKIRLMSGRGSWLYQPLKGMCGKVVFTWYPNHPLRSKRSHVGDYIHLVAIPAMTNGLVPVGEKGCRPLSSSECAMQAVMATTAEHLEFTSRVNDILSMTLGILSPEDEMMKYLGLDKSTRDLANS